MTNEFQSLLHIDDSGDFQLLTAFETNRITSNDDEIIDIYYAEAAPGKWCHGYRVYWANGRQSYLTPSPANGWFASAREAQLYVLGFMNNYRQFFLPVSQSALTLAMNKLLQTSINFF